VKSIGNWLALVLLGIDALLLAIVELFFLPLRFDGTLLPDLGGFPFPIVVLIAIITNPLLTRAATRIRPTLFAGGFPVFVWFVVTLALALGGPANTFTVYPDWRILALLAGGALPAAVVLGRELGRAPGAQARGRSSDNGRVRF